MASKKKQKKGQLSRAKSRAKRLLKRVKMMPSRKHLKHKIGGKFSKKTGKNSRRGKTGRRGKRGRTGKGLLGLLGFYEDKTNNSCTEAVRDCKNIHKKPGISCRTYFYEDIKNGLYRPCRNPDEKRDHLPCRPDASKFNYKCPEVPNEVYIKQMNTLSIKEQNLVETEKNLELFREADNKIRDSLANTAYELLKPINNNYINSDYAFFDNYLNDYKEFPNQLTKKMYDFEFDDFKSTNQKLVDKNVSEDSDLVNIESKTRELYNMVGPVVGISDDKLITLKNLHELLVKIKKYNEFNKLFIESSPTLKDKYSDKRVRPHGYMARPLRSLGKGPGSMGKDPGSIGKDPGSIGKDPGSMGKGPGSMGKGPGSEGSDSGSEGSDSGSNIKSAEVLMAENALKRAIDNISRLDNDGHYNELLTKRDVLFKALTKDPNVSTSMYINQADEIIERLGNQEVGIPSNPNFPQRSVIKYVKRRDLYTK